MTYLSLSSLSTLADVLAIVTCIASVIAAIRLLNQNRRLKEMVDRMPKANDLDDLIRLNEGKKSLHPVALAFSLTSQTGSIKKTVENFLSSKNMAMPIEEVMMEGINGREGIVDFINKVKQKKRFIEGAGYTEVHLFISGPVQAGTLLGAFFDHWLPVKLYHRPNPPPPQFYEYWAPLFKN